MNLRRQLCLAAGLMFAATLASAGTISYVCDPGVAATTCNYLNTTVAGAYSSTFTDANASIYIQYGTTGLASTQAEFNVVSYADYVAALTSNAATTANTIQTEAVASLATNAAAAYGAGDVNITASLAEALGLTPIEGNLVGVEADGSTLCSVGAAGCYNAVVTVTNDPGTPLYYDNVGGPEPPDAYDFYATVEHETDEVLGTASCIDTTGALSDGCDFFGTGTPSDVDLFRYSAPGSLILDSSLSTAPGAYFSYDGGVTNGVTGPAGPKFYNTLANGEDYADFVSSSPDCGTNHVIQDAEGCPGEDAGLSILNDGGGEINILTAVGFDQVPSTVTVIPEPGTTVLFGAGLAAIGLIRRRRRV